MNSPSGLQAERTRLAWRRTSLAMTVVTVLAVRLALTRGLAGALLAAAALAGWVAVLWLTFPRIAGTHRRHPEGGGSALPLLALAAVGYAVLGMLLVLAALG